MNTLVRVVFGMSIVGSLMSLICTTRPAWFVPLNLDWWNLPVLCQLLHEEQTTSVRLDEIKVRTDSRREDWNALIMEVISDRKTLLEAASILREMGEAPRAPLDSTDRLWPGSSMEEKYCRRIIAAVRAVPAPESATEAEAVACRLEAELDGYLHSHFPESFRQRR